MHIVILAPSDRSFIIKFLSNLDERKLPVGYFGAPFIGTIISELLKKSHKVTAITTSVAINNDYEVKRFTEGNFKWIVVPARPRSFRSNGNKRGRMIDLYSYEVKQMLKEIQALNPDFVHAHWSYEFAKAAIKSGFPALVTVHDNAFQVMKYFRNAYRFGRMVMAELNLKKVLFASSVSPYMEAYVKRNVKEFRIIPNPITIDMTISDIQIALDSKIRTLQTPRLVMINSGWDFHKNGMSGLLAFKHLLETIPNATLHLYGGGSEKNGLAHEDALKIGVKNVFFHGAVSHDYLMKELKKSHVLLHPALEESFGVVLIEAMACGVPAIGGLHSGAVPFVIDNAELLVNVKNPVAISNCAIDLLTNKVLYESTALSCFNNAVSRFSANEVVNKYEDYYDYILKNW